MEIQAHSCKFPLVDNQRSLLSVHEGFMRLHSDGQIESMSREAILSFLQLGVRCSMYNTHNTSIQVGKVQKQLLCIDLYLNHTR